MHLGVRGSLSQPSYASRWERISTLVQTPSLSSCQVEIPPSHLSMDPVSWGHEGPRGQSQNVIISFPIAVIKCPDYPWRRRSLFQTSPPLWERHSSRSWRRLAASHPELENREGGVLVPRSTFPFHSVRGLSHEKGLHPHSASINPIKKIPHRAQRGGSLVKGTG